jgi:phosphodiesterase/alkaline phosphatase D-like protein
MKLRNGIPRVFQFAGLKPGVRWIVNFPNTTNAEVRVGSFKTHPNDVTALSIISFSCNAVLIEPEEPSVWQDLVDMYIKPKKVDLLLHVGDQVYADSAWEEGMKLVKTAPAMTSELHEKITELYRVIYRKTWNYAPTQYTLANVPNLMIWVCCLLFNSQ